MWKRCQLLGILLQILLTSSRLVPPAWPKGVPRMNNLRTPTFPTLRPLTTTVKTNVKDIAKFYDPLAGSNGEFCASIATEALDYPVTPWWYRYCVDLMQNKKEKLKDPVNIETVKRYISDEMKAYKALDKMESRKNMNRRNHGNKNIINKL